MILGWIANLGVMGAIA